MPSIIRDLEYILADGESNTVEFKESAEKNIAVRASRFYGECARFRPFFVKIMYRHKNNEGKNDFFSILH
jgi:hypothetical protein